jgi:uncharacterized protein (TIGR02145 family)
MMSEFPTVMNQPGSTRHYPMKLYCLCEAILTFAITLLFFFSACNKSDDNNKVTDMDGNKYSTVHLGTQTWFAENLRTTHYSDGTEIPNLTGYLDFCTSVEGARCVYENNEQMGDIYGMMYNWYAAFDTCSICPDGWHVPSAEEWGVLIDYLGGKEAAGGKMKSTDTTLWDFPNVGASNESGFAVLPGGYRDQNGWFIGEGFRGIFWATDIFNYTCAYNMLIQARDEAAQVDFATFGHAFYIRCIKNE